MRKLLIAMFLFASLSHAASVITILSSLVKCPASSPALIAWTGSQFVCATLGPGLSLTNGVLTVSIATPPAPAWQVETVSLANLAANATSISYTTAKPPINGMILWWYISTNPMMPTGGPIQYTGTPNPITFTLPVGWSSADSIQIAYQSQ